MKKMYYVRNGMVLSGEVVKETKRGTAVFIKSAEGEDVLVSYSKLFRLESEAREYLASKQRAKEQKEIRLKKEIEKEQEGVDKILDKIYEEFGVEVKYLSKPIFIEDAQKLYRYIKKNNIVNVCI